MAMEDTIPKTDFIWHKSSVNKGIVPHSGIDPDARWGYSHTKGWVFGYKLHLTSTTTTTASAVSGGGEHLVVPLTADVTTANVPDNKMYVSLTSPFSVFSLPSVLYTIADLGYDGKKLYEYSKRHWE